MLLVLNCFTEFFYLTQFLIIKVWFNLFILFFNYFLFFFNLIIEVFFFLELFFLIFIISFFFLIKLLLNNFLLAVNLTPSKQYIAFLNLNKYFYRLFYFYLFLFRK